MISRIKGMESWQKKKLLFWFLLFFLFGVTYLTVTCSILINDKNEEVSYWENTFTNDSEVLTEANDIAEKYNATKVTVGSYVEDLKNMSLKEGSFKVSMVVWFKWTGDDELDFNNAFRFYKGIITSSSVVRDYTEGDLHYQAFRVEATIYKNYWTVRFPLESHQLRIYIEPEHTVDTVVFEADKDNSTYNPSMSISGYNIRNYDTGIYYMKYPTSENSPGITDKAITTEYVTAFEINRSSMGVYLKCFIAMFGTTIWVLIILYICTFHRVDPLSMIPAALFGTVSNIMVGASLLPDALDLGLLEYTNIWGIVTILAVTLAVININRVRNKYEDRDFARLYGKVMFIVILSFVIIGNIALPVSAYLF